MTNPATTSLLDRASLDRDAVRSEIARGLAGADDGELFLEYSQTEALTFDNGRLKQATYDTSQGFGLRAVKDDAVGYAHSSDVSLPALMRAADAVSAVRGGYSGNFASPPPHTNVRLYGDDNPLDAPGFESKVKLLGEIDAYLRDKDPRVRQVTVSLGATWQVVEIIRPDGESYRDIRPLVRVNVSVVAGQGDRQESGSKGYGGREAYARFIETKAWQDKADLGRAYIAASSHAYGEGVFGDVETERFTAALSRMDVTVKNEDTREYDMLSCTDFYNYYGGLIAAATTVRGEAPSSFVGDSSDPSRIATRTTTEEARL
ncbi:MAG: cobaltochelatase subunit CobN, partial [Paeniclostridium sordellii]|nr:cobaltochelatase subunit CobN [Paeniclostridium sordellii]